MNNRFYQAPDIQIDRVVYDLESYLSTQGYQVQHFGDKQQMVVQFRRGSTVEAFIGMQAAITIVLQRVAGGVTATIGQQQWLDKAVVGLLGFVFWPFFVTAGIGTIRQIEVENQAISALDNIMVRQYPGVHISSSAAEQPFYYQQGGPSYQSSPAGAPASPNDIRCPNCQELNESDSSYCIRCGKPLGEQKKRCSRCEAEVKADAAFCPRCGNAFAETASA
jgi:RNA polymerase subunit RPABC4/transcription elongation factor Spt4